RHLPSREDRDGAPFSALIFSYTSHGSLPPTPIPQKKKRESHQTRVLTTASNQSMASTTLGTPRPFRVRIPRRRGCPGIPDTDASSRRHKPCAAREAPMLGGVRTLRHGLLA